MLTLHRALAVATALAFTVTGAFAGTATAATTGTGINTTSKTAVNAAYWKMWQPSQTQQTGWTGNLANCKAGTTSTAGRSRQIGAINFARGLAHLAPVRAGSAAVNAHAQQAALMMAANHQLSHTPPSSWKCYTSDGAAAAGASDIFLAAGPVSAGTIVNTYLVDPGDYNTAAAHRRWLLYPALQTVGIGATDRSSAITVIGVPWNTANPNPAWVSWPTPGWFPSPAEPDGRWSLSAGDDTVSFANATVHVTRNGTPVKVTTYPVEDGYGMPTLVWQLPGTAPASGVYTVTVTNITSSTQTTPLTHSYTVRFFTPARPRSATTRHTTNRHHHRRTSQARRRHHTRH